MGIDFYAYWPDVDKERREYVEQGGNAWDFQSRGSSGYLRESYHGGVYATQVLAPECWQEDQYEETGMKFDSDYGDWTLKGVPFTKEMLEERREEVIQSAYQRGRQTYNIQDYRELKAFVQEYVDFLSLCLEKIDEHGSVWLYSSY